ncbi:hypothetical protein L484_009042 [Morus notabilis]|uniref:Uncharacterized protein n=1 Tax=Morus notabilis TaxID=981085 RepID=W9RJ89_9ROSA|nr:hypothetical protein L484_009042 [Morus notabilis]
MGIIPKAFTKNRMCGPTLGEKMPIWSIPERIATMLHFAEAFIALLGGLDSAVENGIMFSAARRILNSASTIEELREKLQAFQYIPEPVILQIEWSRKRKKNSNKRGLDVDLNLHL